MEKIVKNRIARSISFLLIILMLVSSMMSSFDSYASVRTGSDLCEYTYRIALDCGNIKYKMTYGDSLFTKDARELSLDTCKASLALAESCLGTYNYGTDLTEYYNCSDFFNKLGFINPTPSEDYGKPTAENTIGVVAAYKIITDENGEQVPLIAIAIRGSRYDYEWRGNFNAGEKGNHEGFTIASKKVLAFLRSYIDEQAALADSTDISKTGKAVVNSAKVLKSADHVKFWISGYSRAAATANLTAAAIDDWIADGCSEETPLFGEYVKEDSKLSSAEEETSALSGNEAEGEAALAGDGTLSGETDTIVDQAVAEEPQEPETSVRTIDASDLYAYTFSTPCGCDMKTNSNPHGARYSNIFNVINPHDLIAKLAPSSFGFCRYGTDLYLPSQQNSAQHDALYDKFNTERKRIVTAFHNSEDNQTFYSEDEFERYLSYDSVNDYYALSSLWSLVYSNFDKDHEKYASQDIFFTDMIESLKADIVPDRQAYYDKYQSRMQDLSDYVFVKISRKGFRIIGEYFRENLVKNNLPDLIKIINALQNGKIQDAKAPLIKILWAALDSSKSGSAGAKIYKLEGKKYTYEDVVNCVNAVYALDDLIADLVDKHESELATLLYHELIAGDQGIMKGHDVTTMNAWLEAMGDTPCFSYGQYRKVEVYGVSGTNNKKTAYYPADGEYQLKLTGNASGTVICRITEYTPSVKNVVQGYGNATRVVEFNSGKYSFQSVKINLPKYSDSEIKNTNGGSSVEYSCKMGSSNVSKTSDLKKKDIDKLQTCDVNVTINNEGLGSVEKNSICYKGDITELTAVPTQYSKFVGWYDADGKLLSDEAVYLLDVGDVDAIELKAVFEFKYNVKGLCATYKLNDEENPYVELTWDGSDESGVIESYDIYRNDEKIAEVNAKDVAKYTDNNVEKDKTYTYHITAKSVEIGGSRFESDLEYAKSKAVTIDTSKKALPEITLGKKIITYNGKTRTQSVKLKNNWNALREGKDYVISGTLKAKKIGKYTVKAEGIGAYTGSVQATYYISPKGTKLSKLSAGKKSVTVKWKKQSSKTSGYIIQYSTDKNFTSSVKSVKVSKTGATSKKLSKLKSKTRYYVRVATYKRVNGVNCRSNWSRSKSVKVK